MAKHKVEPVIGFEGHVLEDYTQLTVECAGGFSAMMDILAENEPGILYRCGLIGDRHEVYAISLPDCQRRAMIVSIDRKDPSLPRALHGTLPASKRTHEQGVSLAADQLGLATASKEL